MAKKLPVCELFGPTIQGEGALAGTISHFLRLGGCPRRCVQCDSLHAVLPELIKMNATYMYPAEVTQAITELPPAEWLTFSGGDPLMWKNLGEVVHGVKNRTSIKLAVETQGDLWQDWLKLLDHVTVSPKAPGMDPEKEVKWDMLDEYVSNLSDRMCFKVVVFTERDLLLVRALIANYGIPMYISIGTDVRTFENVPEDIDGVRSDILQRMAQVFDWVKEDAILAKNVRILPQTHVLIWGTQLGV